MCCAAQMRQILQTSQQEGVLITGRSRLENLPENRHRDTGSSYLVQLLKGAKFVEPGRRIRQRRTPTFLPNM